MVQANGRAALGCDQDLVGHQTLPLSEAPGGDPLSKVDWLNATIPSASAEREEVKEANHVTTRRLQSRWLSVVRCNVKLLRDSELEAKVLDFAFQCYDQERGIVHA